MPAILQHRKPGLVDVRCEKHKFLPGDRILVRSFHKLDKDQMKKIKRTITKWAGCEVEVLIYNGLDMEIAVERPTRKIS